MDYLACSDSHAPGGSWRNQIVDHPKHVLATKKRRQFPELALECHFRREKLASVDHQLLPGVCEVQVEATTEVVQS